MLSLNSYTSDYIIEYIENNEKDKNNVKSINRNRSVNG